MAGNVFGVRLGLTPFYASYSYSAEGLDLDASTDKVGIMFQVEEDCTITRLYVAGSSLTGTSPTYKIGLQGVDSSFLPDGTYKGGGSPASHSQQLVAAGNTITLDNAYAATRGEILALVVEHDSGTIDGSNFVNVLYGLNNTFAMGAGPFPAENTGSWNKKGRQPCFFGYGSASRWYGRPARDITTVIPGSTAGYRAAMKFTLPTGMGNSFKVLGLELGSRPMVSANAAFTFGLWDAAGSVIQDVSLDQDFGVDGSQGKVVQFLFNEGALTALAFGTAYYIGFETPGGTQVEVDGLVFDDANLRAAFGLGANLQLASWSGSSWTDEQKAPIYAALILDEFL